MRSGYGYLPSRPFLETCLPGLLTSVETIQNEALLPMPVHEFKPKQLFYNEDNLKQIQQLEQILEPLNQSNYQKLIAETENSCGITVLLSGGPGVGKTELARQLALKTKRELYIFQPSQQRSKWFGDTEKNIQRVFEDYRKACAQSEITPILFFNEADSIIHKRSDNGSFTSQTENAVLTILLQELEQFDGILICTTNRPDTFDEAFDRRFLFKIHIDEPEQQTRATLLGHYFGQLSELEIDHLSAYPFTAAELDNFKRQQLISRLAQQESKNMAQDLESFLLHLHKNKRQNKIGYYEN
jgi:SpoVK/Ycf46/Vps4 family AAA+-type ATPase